MKKVMACVFFAALLFLPQVYSQSFDGQGNMVIHEVSSDKNYGFKPTRKHAIKVGSIENEYRYLQSLCGPSGEEITYIRLGSCCGFKLKSAAFGEGLLDKWEITYEGCEQPIVIYLNGYEYDNPQCPLGLSIKRPAEETVLQ